MRLEYLLYGHGISPINCNLRQAHLLALRRAAGRLAIVFAVLRTIMCTRPTTLRSPPSQAVKHKGKVETWAAAMHLYHEFINVRYVSSDDLNLRIFAPRPFFQFTRLASQATNHVSSLKQRGHQPTTDVTRGTRHEYVTVIFNFIVQKILLVRVCGTHPGTIACCSYKEHVWRDCAWRSAYSRAMFPCVTIDLRKLTKHPAKTTPSRFMTATSTLTDPVS